MPTARREPRRVRRARRAAAFHAARTRKADTPFRLYRAAADALVSAMRHHSSGQEVREMRDELVEHVEQVMQQAETTGSRRDFQRQRLASPGTDVQRLGIALMCLQGAITRLTDTERDRLFGHYSEHFSAESQRIVSRGGDR